MRQVPPLEAKCHPISWASAGRPPIRSAREAVLWALSRYGPMRCSGHQSSKWPGSALQASGDSAAAASKATPATAPTTCWSVILGDDLYCCQPVGTLIADSLFICKPSSHKTLSKQVPNPRIWPTGWIHTRNRNKQLEFRRFQWRHNVPLRAGKDGLANLLATLNLFAFRLAALGPGLRLGPVAAVPRLGRHPPPVLRQAARAGGDVLVPRLERAADDHRAPATPSLGGSGSGHSALTPRTYDPPAAGPSREPSPAVCLARPAHRRRRLSACWRSRTAWLASHKPSLANATVRFTPNTLARPPILRTAGCRRQVTYARSIETWSLAPARSPRGRSCFR